MPSRPGLLVGVTGGIGSGKSAFCSALAACGRKVLSADEISRKIADSDATIKASIRSLLGDVAYDASGRMNRRWVAGVVFRERKLRIGLERILHPGVFAVIEEELAQMPAEAQRPYVVIEAALIFESGMDQRLDRIVVVDAPIGTRIDRIMKRDKLPRASVALRMRAQLPQAGKKQKADIIVRNEGSLAELEARARFVDSLLERMFWGKTAPAS